MKACKMSERQKNNQYSRFSLYLREQDVKLPIENIDDYVEKKSK